jgi:spore coat polysaccharide biosynthesis predicted glycosyltransferase SpsG
MKKIAFRTMGGKRIGYGHIYRCLSLAKAIRKKSFNYEIIFIVNQEVESLVRESNFELVVSNYFQEDMNFIKEMHVDLFILDSYEANNLYLKNISNFVKLMLFDDNNNT